MINLIRSSRYLLGATLLLMVGLNVSGCAQTVVKEAAQASEPPLLGPPSLNPKHPQRYTVVPGDTLWGISEQFLAEPWRWTELWPATANMGQTQSVFPGDVIEISSADGQPQLSVANSGERPTIKLSPQVRVEYISQPVPVVPPEAVKGFINNSLVLSEADWKGAPYVVGSADGRINMMTGDVIFARGEEFDLPSYRVFRPGQAYRDPENGEFLGFEMTFLAEADLIEEDDPATLSLSASRQGVQIGDRLLAPTESQEIFTILPKSAPAGTQGQIIAVPDNTLLIGKYATVVINLGDLDDMKPGDVLAVYQPGREVRDSLLGKKVELPGGRSGLIMLYKIFDRVSYGLVAQATVPMRVLDQVREP